MSNNGEAWRMMAADLYDRAARMVRTGEADDAPEVARLAEHVIHFNEHETDYCAGLEAVGLTPEQIAAALSAILDGKLPPDSLAGKVAEHRRDASKRRDVAKESGEAYALGHAGGCSGTARYVLDLLGVKVSP